MGVSCRNLYSFVVNLYVNGSGSITSVGEERATGYCRDLLILVVRYTLVLTSADKTFLYFPSKFYPYLNQLFYSCSVLDCAVKTNYIQFTPA